MNMRKLAAGLAGTMVGLGFSAQALAEELLGQPTPDAIHLQQAASPLKHSAIFFHNAILMPIITAITVFVAVLLLIIVVRFNKKANPVPAKFSHNTALEVAWTLIPVGILLFISIFSFKLLFAYHDMPKPDLTIKATGYQWYWGYTYPDQKIEEITSVMLSEADAKKADVPYRLAADNSLVVPVGKVVRVLVTGSDVIHNFAMPAFGLKTDAIPGRINETWFKAEKTGMFYGQCSELCGVDHAFMPIQIKVVTQPEFDAWVVEKTGGNKPADPVAAAIPASTPPAPAAAPVAATPVAAAPAPQKTAQLDVAAKPVAMN
jgi:cytochrome c oxidase subunit 2